MTVFRQFLVPALAVAVLFRPAIARGGQSESPQTALPGAVAIVEGATLTAADVDTRAASQLAEIRAQERLVRESALNELIDEKLIEKAAAARGVGVSELLRTEVEEKVVVSEAEKKSTFERYRDQLAGLSEQEALARVEEALKQQQAEELRQALVARLRTTASVRILAEPVRVAVDVPTGAPSRGPSDAPVTIVIFSDFQCPFCFRANASIEEVVQRYGDHVRLVFRDFPLPMHPDAQKAHEAGRCAAEQGKFWPMHDRMFADQTALTVDGLKKSAASLGLDMARFNECLDSRRHTAAVQRDLQAGEGYGVTGTPAFFINGRLLSGAQPFSSFSRVIDDELQRKGVRIPPVPSR